MLETMYVSDDNVQADKRDRKYETLSALLTTSFTVDMCFQTHLYMHAGCGFFNLKYGVTFFMRGMHLIVKPCSCIQCAVPSISLTGLHSCRAYAYKSTYVLMVSLSTVHLLPGRFYDCQALYCLCIIYERLYLNLLQPDTLMRHVHSSRDKSVTKSN